jgi:hypothetical protein
METKITSPAVKGVIISLVLIVLGLAIYFTGQSQNSALQWVQSLLFGVGIIWAAISFSKQSDGNVTFGNVFAHSFKTSMAATAIMLVYTFVFLKFIAPSFVDQAIEISRQKMEAKGNLTAEQIDQAIAMTKKFFMPFAIGGGLVVDLILGAIFSLLGAAVAKKNLNYQPLEQ